MEMSTNHHKISDTALLLIKLLTVITFILYNKKNIGFIYNVYVKIKIFRNILCFFSFLSSKYELILKIK